MQALDMEMQIGVEQHTEALQYMSTTETAVKVQTYVNRNEIKERKLYWLVRRTQDIFFSALALIVLGIPMLIVALVVWIDSPGASPIFVQDRVGRNGKIFKFYKFRSMVPNAEEKLSEVLAQNEMDGPVFKMKHDPRITRVGRFSRSSSTY